MQQILLKVAKVVGKEVLRVAIAETARILVDMLKDNDNDNDNNIV